MVRELTACLHVRHNAQHCSQLFACGAGCGSCTELACTYVCTYVRTHRADCEAHAVMCCAQMYQRVFECKFLQETEVLYRAKGQEMVNSEEFTVSG